MNATISGHRITTARTMIPAWGLWHVEVATDKAVELSGTVELALADLKLKGAVLNGGTFLDRSAYRIVAGAGNWGKELPRRSYANDAGIKVSQIIADAAQEAGEKVDITSSEKVGVSFVRPKGPASRVLEMLAPQAWYVGEDGVLRLGTRPARKLSQKVAVQSIDRAYGTVSIASDQIAELLPGVSVEGVEALDAQHDFTDKAIRTTLWGKRGGAGSRRLAAFRAIFEALDPGRKFRGMYEYRVVQADGDRLDLQVVRVSTGMPDLRRVPVRPGVPGCKGTFVPGARVVVGFVDASPSGAFVSAGEEVGSDAFKPLLLEIDAQTFIKIGAGLKPVGVAGDPGNPAIVPSQVKVLA